MMEDDGDGGRPFVGRVSHSSCCWPLVTISDPPLGQRSRPVLTDPESDSDRPGALTVRPDHDVSGLELLHLHSGLGAVSRDTYI